MAIDTIIGDALARPVPPEIRALATHLMRDRSGIAAILAYGSCLRGVATSDSLVDLYLLTDGATAVSSNVVSSTACRVVPPNVYYTECDVDGLTFRAKYAVLPIDQFARWMTADNPYFWARFSQPSALVFSAGPQARQAVVAAVAQAATTMIAAAKGLVTTNDPVALWAAGFAATYGTELRAETAARAHSIVSANAAYYAALTAALKDVAPAPASWRARALRGKLWSVARLVKAAFTFSGGADYIVWKIERHTGQHIALSPWQRRHPVLAGLMLLPNLLKRGAVR